MPNKWQAVLDEIKNSVSDMAFNTYFVKNFKFVEQNDKVVTISVPSAFVRATIEGKYRRELLSSLKSAGFDVDDFEIIINSSSTKTTQINRGVEVIRGEPSPAPAQIKHPSSGSQQSFASSKTGLNPKYRLDNYVIGSNNDLAVSAAQAVIENPGQRYNPYFIYGGSGLGKTHLIQAIGNELKEKNPKLVVLYVTIEEFYHDFVLAMQKKKEGFQEKYRKVDVLIVDDFQFIVNKKGSQDEFFHTFNELYAQNKQVIVAADRLPSQIATVDPRLASRLTGGVSIDIQLPDFETRCAILKSKAELLGEDVDNTTIESIAENYNTNIRDLEGALNNILALADLRGIPTSEVINEISPTIQSPKRSISSRQVIDKVARYYSLNAKDLLGKSRIKDIKNARQVAMYLMNEELGMSTTKIGNELSKDHSTVIHGIRVVKNNLKTDFSLREQVSELRGKLYAN